MSTRTVRHTDYFIEDGDNSFPVNFEPVDGSEIIQITGNAAKVGYLVHDPESHFNWYFDEYDGQGKFYGYDPHSKGHDPKDRDEVAEIARDNPGRVFWIHKYEHGSSRYYRAGEALTPAVELHDTEPAEPGLFIPDQQWDVSRGAALFVVPEDATEPAEYCDATMREFSSMVRQALKDYLRTTAEKVELSDLDLDGVDGKPCFWATIDGTDVLVEFSRWEGD